MHRCCSCFVCMGEVNPEDFQVSNSGFLYLGDLENVLPFEYLPECEPSNEIYTLFGFDFGASALLDPDILFQMVKRHISSLQALTRMWKGQTLGIYSVGQSECEEYSRMRQDINIFFFSLRSQLQYLQLAPDYEADGDTNEKVLHSLCILLAQLKGLLLFIGRLSDIPDHVISGGISCYSSRNVAGTYHYYHMLLDVRWSVTVCLHILDRLNWPTDILAKATSLSNAEVLSQDSPISQCVCLLLWDLVALVAKRFVKLPKADFFKWSPFNCTCIREMWILLLNLINARSNWNQHKDFWFYFNSICETILNNPKGTTNESKVSIELATLSLIPPTFSCCEPNLLVLWLLVHVAPLYQYDTAGNYSSACRVQNNYPLLQRVMKSILSTQCERKDLQLLLQCCLKLTLVWEPNVDMLLPFTEFFLKNLDEDFHQVTYGLDNRCIVQKSGMLWSNYIGDIVDRGASWNSQDSGFQLYLQLLSCQIKLLDASKRATTYKQIKGRILPKITAKSVQNLTEMGLHNFFSLLLLLGCLAEDVQDMRDKVCIVANMVRDSSRLGIAWKAIFAVIISMQDARQDVHHVAKKAVKQFSAFCQSFVASGVDNLQRHKNSSMLMVFLEGLKEVVDNSPNLALSEYLLFDGRFGVLLAHLNVSELSVALSCTESLVTNLRNFCQSQTNIKMLFIQEPKILEQHKSMLLHVTENIVPFLAVHASTQTPPSQIANIVATLCLLSLDGVYDTLNGCFPVLFQQFAANPKVNSRVSSDFLSHLLSNPNVVLVMDDEHKVIALRVWIRRVVSTLPPSEPLDRLTRLVFDVVVTCKRMEWLDTTALNCEDGFQQVAIRLFDQMGKAWKAMSEHRAKMRLQQMAAELLQDFPAVVLEELKETSSSALTNHIFRMAGLLVSNVAPVLYCKGKSDCLLPLILDSTILPLSLIRDKPISPLVLSASKQFLGLFVEGVSQLPYRSDTYVERKLRDIVCHYLPRFPLRGSTSSQVSHPLLAAVMERTDIDLTVYVMEIIEGTFFSRKNASVSPHFLQALSFGLEIVTLANDKDRKGLLPMLTSSILEHLLLSANSEVIQACRDALDRILQLSSRDKEPLLSAFRSLVEKRLPWSSNRLFKLLEYVAEVAPDLMSALLPFVTKSVETVEEKRGLGRDQALRQGIINVANKLHRDNNSVT